MADCKKIGTNALQTPVTYQEAPPGTYNRLLILPASSAADYGETDISRLASFCSLPPVPPVAAPTSRPPASGVLPGVPPVVGAPPVAIAPPVNAVPAPPDWPPVPTVPPVASVPPEPLGDDVPPDPTEAPPPPTVPPVALSPPKPGLLGEGPPLAVELHPAARVTAATVASSTPCNRPRRARAVGIAIACNRSMSPAHAMTCPCFPAHVLVRIYLRSPVPVAVTRCWPAGRRFEPIEAQVALPSYACSFRGHPRGVQS